MYMTLIWCLSPLLGFFLVPLLGSLSDRCKFRLGRRRPFIIILSVGIIIGLLLVPNGKHIGVLFGDEYSQEVLTDDVMSPIILPSNDKLLNDSMNNQVVANSNNKTNFNVFWRGLPKDKQNYNQNEARNENEAQNEFQNEDIIDTEPGDVQSSSSNGYFDYDINNYYGTGSDREPTEYLRRTYPHPFSILFTVLGVILLDFSCDACQSPCRAYMLDVTVPEDHPGGLSTFTVLAGKCQNGVNFFLSIEWHVESIARNI